MEAGVGSYGTQIGLFEGQQAPEQPKQFWREDKGILYFDVVSSGRNPDDWIVRLYASECWLGGHHYVKDMLLLGGFTPTNKKHTIAVMRDSLFPKSASRAEMDGEAARHGFIKPTMEIACLMREAVSSEDIRRMGFDALMVMHEPVKTRSRHESLHNVNVLLMLYEFEERACLGAHFCGAPSLYKKNRGFIYAVPDSEPAA